ncbi:hypothetical protein [Parasitella parasitica]|uniref:Uncharacterized protein n=1 Tax=Parasitella parasitica TaxID=35722 RepID=A0A0B7NQB1_9FUNG|nr:hypothetical protein [Parasitella parasitica]
MSQEVTVAIVGTGLVGALNAIYSAQRRWKVELFVKLQGPLPPSLSSFLVNADIPSRAPVGTRPVVNTPVTRAATHTLLGAITADTVIHVPLRKPAPPAPKPKRARR